MTSRPKRAGAHSGALTGCRLNFSYTKVRLVGVVNSIHSLFFA
jgi:hypothetical protein